MFRAGGAEVFSAVEMGEKSGDGTSWTSFFQCQQFLSCTICLCLNYIFVFLTPIFTSFFGFISVLFVKWDLVHCTSIVFMLLCQNCVFTLTDSEGELKHRHTHWCTRGRMQLNPCLFFFLFFPLSFSSLLPGESSPLLPGERVEIFARALHSLIPGHGTWSEAGEFSTNII